MRCRESFIEENVERIPLLMELSRYNGLACLKVLLYLIGFVHKLFYLMAYACVCLKKLEEDEPKRF